MNIKKNIISLFMSVIIIACCSNSLNAATINKATANLQISNTTLLQNAKLLQKDGASTYYLLKYNAFFTARADFHQNSHIQSIQNS